MPCNMQKHYLAHSYRIAVDCQLNTGNARLAVPHLMRGQRKAKQGLDLGIVWVNGIDTEIQVKILARKHIKCSFGELYQSIPPLCQSRKGQICIHHIDLQVDCE